ncbi:MAG: IdeS/Mac family cysteine endopeptidase [Bacteroidaceae bacterium]|nr:IdeS/Mac family cysteine endopeptidase [Bacteroidaceae bacterium]
MKRLSILPILCIAMFVACNLEDVYIVVKEGITLKTDTREIVADSVDMVTFMVKSAGKDVTASSTIYDASTELPLEGFSFVTSRPDTFSFYARRGDVRSKTITIVAVPIPENSSDTISPDTVPSVQPDTVPPVQPDTVPPVQPDTVPPVQPDTVPPVQPDTIPPVQPDTVPPVQPDTVPPVHPDTVPPVQPDTVPPVQPDTVPPVQPDTVPPAPPVVEGTTIVFARGVTRESGWYDVNKRGNGQSHGDINMCWAASTSNIIEWWQDRYREAGYELPEGAVTGPGETYELALMELFHEQWDNSRGGHVYHAVPWYFEGINICAEASPGSQSQPLDDASGGYYKEVWSNIYPHLYHEYDYLGLYTGLYVGEFNNYMLWGTGAGYDLSDEERHRIFSNYVIELMSRGMISMGIALAANLSSLHHATTLWGYEVDNATGLVTKVWITDSDDMDRDPKVPVLHEYTVSVSGSRTIKLSGEPYGACYVVTLVAVSGYDMF